MVTQTTTTATVEAILQTINHTDELLHAKVLSHRSAIPAQTKIQAVLLLLEDRDTNATTSPCCRPRPSGTPPVLLIPNKPALDDFIIRWCARVCAE